MDNEKSIPVYEDIFAQNDKVAESISSSLKEKNILAINVLGSPGIGKTTVITNIIKGLKEENAFVIEGDIESEIDTAFLNSIGIKAFQINTKGGCHLDAPSIQETLKDLQIAENGVLFIENIGNLVCPAEFNIGEHLKLLIVSVTDGSDKPYKYPLAFQKADFIILNKIDLLPYVDFDEEFFLKGIRAQNKNVPVFKVTSKKLFSFNEVVAWIKQKKR